MLQFKIQSNFKVFIFNDFSILSYFPFPMYFHGNVTVMNIAYWNIHNLNERKFEDDMFISSVCKYDVICFAETMLGDSPGNLPGFAPPFILKPKRKKRGRPSGGLLIYIKPHYKKGITEIKQNQYSIWLKMNKSHFNLSTNLFLCFTYIKPYLNKELSETTFAQLESDINLYSSQGDLVICGDCNARTGGLSDYIQDDFVNENFVDCPMPQDYISDIPLKRQQLDQKSNFHGTLLTNICKSSQFRIVNGRFLGDSLGYYTFFNMNGKSTVYYMLVSQDLLCSVNSFVVTPPLICQITALFT